MTTNNECDFGQRGIQYVHYPYHRERYQEEPRSVKQDGLFRFLYGVLKHRLRPWRRISGFSFERMRRNLTLVNSEWSKQEYRNSYDAGSIPVYPPIPGNFFNVPWHERENGFVCIGRISSEKRYEIIIEILIEVRKQYPDIHLHIIGSYVDYDDDYFDVIRQKIEENHDWIFFHENVSHQELVNVVSQHRYGIHAMPNEHFGIAVGEMVCGGNIVFAPDDGGQVEILGNEQRLLYKSNDEAKRKIIQVLSHPREQVSLRKHLGLRKHLFTSEKFMQHVREVVSDFYEGNL